MMPNEIFFEHDDNLNQVLVKERGFFHAPSIFDREKLRTSGLCCSLSHLTVHTEMTGNTIEILMKLLYKRFELRW